MVRNAYMGITQREESLLKLYEQHLEDTKKLVGLSKADPTSFLVSSDGPALRKGMKVH